MTSTLKRTPGVRVEASSNPVTIVDVEFCGYTRQLVWANIAYRAFLCPPGMPQTACLFIRGGGNISIACRACTVSKYCTAAGFRQETAVGGSMRRTRYVDYRKAQDGATLNSWTQGSSHSAVCMHIICIHYTTHRTSQHVYMYLITLTLKVYKEEEAR